MQGEGLFLAVLRGELSPHRHGALRLRRRGADGAGWAAALTMPKYTLEKPDWESLQTM